MINHNKFFYSHAFERNLGWVTPEEQRSLRKKRVAIAGLGGVGGSHLITLTRMGVGAFNVSDFDTFDLPNFNRQYGAFISTLGLPKTDVMMDAALDINPELLFNSFPKGISESNLDAFLDGVDLYVDSLDVFVLSLRSQVFAKCREKGIPAIIAGPIGLGCATVIFTPESMSFDDYFGLKNVSEEEQVLRFVAGLTPSMQQMTTLVYPAGANLREKRAPSNIVGIELCAGIAAANALKLLLNRGKVATAPTGFHYDAYRNHLVHTWRPWGYRNPLQQLMLGLLKRKINQS